MSLLLGVRNTADQEVAVGGIINLGNVYRKFCKKVNGVKCFDFTGDAISLNHAGIYHLTATFVTNGGAAGVVTIQMLENGVPALGVYSEQTVSTATTERNFAIDTYILVDNANLLGRETTLTKNISFEVLTTAATIALTVVNVEKVV